MLLPEGCLTGCLPAQKVAYFSCSNSHPNFRQLSHKMRSRSGVTWLPTFSTFSMPGNPLLPRCCLRGCLTRGERP